MSNSNDHNRRACTNNQLCNALGAALHREPPAEAQRKAIGGDNLKSINDLKQAKGDAKVRAKQEARKVEREAQAQAQYKEDVAAVELGYSMLSRDHDLDK